MAEQRRDDIDYLAAVARVRVLETRLLRGQELDRMLDMTAADDVWKLVRELWDLPDEPLDDFERVLGDHLTGSYDYVAGFLPSRDVVHWLGIRNDYHNLKVLLKEELLQETADEGAFSDLGTVPVPQLRVMLGSFEEARPHEHQPEVPVPGQDRLAASYQQAVQEAREGYESTWDPQLIDVLLDRHQMNDSRQAAAGLGEEVQELAGVLAELANLKILLRSNKLGKNVGFLRLALVEGGKLPQYRWEELAGASSDEVATALGSPYEEIIGAAAGDPGRVEREADNYVLGLLGKARYVAMGPWPIVAFLWAKENDVRNVRILLSGKINGASTEAIRERLRDAYV